MISRTEMDRRLAACRHSMKERGLEAVVLRNAVGDTTPSNGNYRYFTGEQTPEYVQIAVLFADDSPPAVFYPPAPFAIVPGEGETAFDYRAAPDVPGAAVSLLRERCGPAPALGVCMDAVPAGYLAAVRTALPGSTFADVSGALLDLRLAFRSEEEVSRQRRSAAMADRAYEEALEAIHVGAEERDVAAVIRSALERQGADSTFLMISSGPFSGERNGLPFLHPARDSGRTLRSGDCIAFEITAACDGYWTQLVRTVGVGAVEPSIGEIHGQTLSVIQAGVERLRAGAPVRAVADGLEQRARTEGKKLLLPYGHLCGTDLTEERVTGQNGRILAPGTGVILHPGIQAAASPWTLFWGETYLAWPDRAEPLNRASRELIIK